MKKADTLYGMAEREYVNQALRQDRAECASRPDLFALVLR